MRGSGPGIIWQGPWQSGAIVGADGADHAKLCRGPLNATGPEGVAPNQFERTERNDERTWACLRDFTAHEGVLNIGKAQEKARVVRRSDFGPLFIKFCSYFPYNAKPCLNGHEYLKRQLAKRGIAFEAPGAHERVADGMTAPTIDGPLRKWLARPGIRHDVSVQQAEFGLTRSSNRPFKDSRFPGQIPPG